MTVQEIRELIDVVTETGIAELEVQRGENRVRIRRTNGAAPSEIVLAPPTSTVLATPVLTSPGAAAASLPSGSGADQIAGAESPGGTARASTRDSTASNNIYVKSPIVGTFYECSAPGSPPFVKVGDRVSPGQVLCIIESMKLMNEIEAEVSGIVVARLVENGRPVEYGEALFTLQPA